MSDLASTSTPVSAPETDEEAPQHVTLNNSANGRVSGKNWKAPKLATRRNQQYEALKTKSWDERMRKTTEAAAVKKLEKELKEEKEAEAAARREKIRSRRKAKEERERLELAKAKMSQKKLDRARRKAGRTKKING